MQFILRNIKKIALPVLVLFLLYNYCLISYTHIHIINGHVVVHTHPFKSDEGVSHKHTLKELVYIDCLVNHYATLVNAFHFDTLLTGIELSRNFNEVNLQIFNIKILNNKSPPFCIL